MNGEASGGSEAARRYFFRLWRLARKRLRYLCLLIFLRRFLIREPMNPRDGRAHRFAAPSHYRKPLSKLLARPGVLGAYQSPRPAANAAASINPDTGQHHHLASTQMPTLDLSHTIEHGMITYPGLPGPTISDFLSREESRQHYAEGTEFHVGRIDMVANTGTYLDTPAHRYADGVDLADVALDDVAGLPGIVVDASGPAIGPGEVFGRDLTGKAVLFRTGWDRHWATEQYGAGGHPHLTAGCAEALVDAGAILAGIDSVNIDDTATGERPVHSTLLAAGVLIVEHLTSLDQIPDSDFRFYAVPVKVRGLGTFPVRAFATW
jgi:arylformamidase